MICTWLGFLWQLLLVVQLATAASNEPDKQALLSSYRLLDSVSPKAYDIVIDQVDLEKFVFSGVEKIDVTILKETNVIQLNKRNLTTSLVSIIDTNSNRTLETKDSLFNETTQVWTLMLGKSLKATSNVRLTIKFSGSLSDDLAGFYKSYYVDESGTTRWLATTQFQKADARAAFPCFDEPAMKATFKISILPPKGYTCLSNMPSSVKNGLYVFDESKRMSTELVAYIVSDFKYVENATANLRVWGRPNTIQYANYALKIAPTIIQYLGDLFGQAYQLPKMDLVGIPDFSAGAMENWGLITFAEGVLFGDETQTQDIDMQWIAMVVTHELVHQWFGNLVTPQWWEYMWMNEGFAQYFKYTVFEKVQPSWKMDLQLYTQEMLPALWADWSKSSDPMNRKVITLSDMNLQSSITYSKSSSILRMMRFTFGDEVFYAALRDHLKNRAYGTTVPDDLWNAFQKQVTALKDPKLNISVAQVMKTWTDQPGYPYVTVTITKDTIKLSQQRFLLSSTNSSSSNSLWWIPITLTSLQPNNTDGQSTKPVYWLSERNAEIPNEKKDELLLLNVKSAGFFRVNYDKESWKRIISVLKSKDFGGIHELNRAGIVDDLLNFARSDLLDYATALDGISYLKTETSYVPFKAALNGIDYLLRRFDSTAGYEALSKFATSLFTNAYEKLTYDDKPGDDHLTIFLRQELIYILCYLGHNDCITKSKNYFSNWQQTGKPIPKNQRATAYCIGIRHGNANDWDYLWKEYGKLQLQAEQNIILQALGCTEDVQILSKFMLKTLLSPQESGIHKGYQKQYASLGLSFEKRAAINMIEFVEQNYAEILKYPDGPHKILNFLYTVLPYYATKESELKLESLIKSNATYLQPVDSYSDLLKNIKSEREWFEKHEKPINDWLKTNQEGI